MKQEVNFIEHYRKVNLKMSEDDLTTIDTALYNSLFFIWNETFFETELSINRNDIMKVAKIGNANTYTTSLKKLDDKGYLKYKPSHNPLIGSRVSMIRFDNKSLTKSGNSSGISSGKSDGNTTDNSGGASGDTLYKLLNLETIKLINDNATLINNNLHKWIKQYNKFKNPLEFYNNQIIQSSSKPMVETYKKFVDFLFFDNETGGELQVLKLPTQITYDNFLKILEKYNRLQNEGKGCSPKEALMKMHNSLNLVKTKKDAYLTLLNYLEYDK